MNERFDKSSLNIALIAVVCILLPTLILFLFALYTSLRSQQFSRDLAREIVPYGLGLVKDKIEEKYRLDCISILDRFKERSRRGSIQTVDLAFMGEGSGMSESLFTYTNRTGILKTFPRNSIRGPDEAKLLTELSTRFDPEQVDSRLHFMPITLGKRRLAVPYTYSFENPDESISIVGFIPNEEFLEKLFLQETMNLDFFSNPTIFQGEVLKKHFAFTVHEKEGIVASTHSDYLPDQLQIQLLDDFLPPYILTIHYRAEKLQFLQDFTPPMLWGLIGFPLALFAIGFYFFLSFTLREIRLSRAKTHFISNVSHEFKTPLGLIRLYNETLELGRFKDEAEKEGFHKTITRETLRLSNMINRLLSFSRMERGQKQYDFEKENLARVVGDTLDDYETQLEAAGFELERNLSLGIEPFPMDKESISQAVINLLDNAMKYSGVNKWIRVTVGEDAGQPFISVEDRGIGIASDEIRRIFDKFYRVEQGLVHEVKGLGIGLAVVKKIIEDHGGKVDVDSAPGKGSRFSLKFKRDT